MTTCVMCEETITNPVCPDCLHSGVRQWLVEQQETRLAQTVLDITIADVKNLQHRALVEDSTLCIKCNRSMNVCTYCYTKDVFDVIKSKPLLVAEYMMFFNFDLEHMGWEQDARNIVSDY
jgi:hypothetical protein